ARSKCAKGRTRHRGRAALCAARGRSAESALLARRVVGETVEHGLARRLQRGLALGRRGALLEAVTLGLEGSLGSGSRRAHLLDARLVLRDVVVALLDADLVPRSRCAGLVVGLGPLVLLVAARAERD